MFVHTYVVFLSSRCIGDEHFTPLLWVVPHVPQEPIDRDQDPLVGDLLVGGPPGVLALGHRGGGRVDVVGPGPDKAALQSTPHGCILGESRGA